MKLVLRIAAGMGVIVLAGAVVVLFSMLRLARHQPSSDELALGISGEGRLTPCPESPNCVSSHADGDDSVHYVTPLPSTDVDRVARWIEASPRTRIVTRRDDYLRATFTSRFFGFVDDLEIYVPEASEVMHVRSASRVGHSDMGVNRRRYEDIAALFSANG